MKRFTIRTEAGAEVLSENVMLGGSVDADGNITNTSKVSIDKKYSVGKQKKVKTRRSQFRFPIQPSLFYISYTEEENVKQYFDL